MHYVVSEDCFETNVFAHALVPVMYLKLELDSFCMKLKGKMLSSCVANALQPQTGLQSVGLN